MVRTGKSMVMCLSIVGKETKMPELTHEQRIAILDKLLECEADVQSILVKLEELQLYDCVLSLRDIAKVLRLSKTRIKQIEQQAMLKIKDKLQESA